MAIHGVACHVPASLSACRGPTRSQNTQNRLGFASSNGLSRVDNNQHSSSVRIGPFSFRQLKCNVHVIQGVQEARKPSGQTKLIRIRRKITCSASAREPFPWGQEHVPGEQAYAQHTIAEVLSTLDAFIREAERTKQKVDALGQRLDDHFRHAGLDGAPSSNEERSRAGDWGSSWESPPTRSTAGGRALLGANPSLANVSDAGASAWKAQLEFWRAQAFENSKAAEALARQLERSQARIAKLDLQQQQTQERRDEADYWRAQAAQASKGSQSMAEELRQSHAKVVELGRELQEAQARVKEQVTGREAAQARVTELGRQLRESQGQLERKEQLMAEASQSAAEELHCSQARAAELEHQLQRAEEMLKQDADGRTALHLAARRGDLDAVRLCVKKGDDINARDKGKYTPLILASIRGHHGVVRLLVERGADVDARDYMGDTALDWARRQGHSQVAWLLEEYSGGVVQQ
eukprot:jgi/Mesvir1/11313/Mv25184-RA.1